MPTNNKQTNNYATDYAQTTPEGTTNTLPILADKHKTVRSYIIQYEGTGDFEQSTKYWIPTLYCECESAQPNNHYIAGGHSYRKICMPGKYITVNKCTAGEPKICTRANPANATLGTTNHKFESKAKMRTSTVLTENLFKIIIPICNEKW